MNNESSERALTPKEQYDAQRQLIDDEKMEANGQDPDEERELDAMTDDAEKIMDNMEEKEIDKTMGETKKPVGPQRIEVSRDQFEKMKADKQAQNALMALKNAQSEHLKPEQQKAMNLLVAEFEAKKITDPVIQHLMKEKIKLLQEYVAAAKEIQLLQRKMLQQVADTTNNLVKVKGAMETTDRMILDRQMEIEVNKKKKG